MKEETFGVVLAIILNIKLKMLNIDAVQNIAVGILITVFEHVQ